MANLSRIDRVSKLVDSENYGNFEFIGHVINEGLRHKSVAAATSPYVVVRDCTVANYKFKKGDKIQFNMHFGLHHNSS